MDSLEITHANPFVKVDQPYVLIAPTYDEEATDLANDFIEFNNINLFKGVIGGGNLNFADLFVFTAKNISKEYDVPMLYSFEYSGSDTDVECVKNILREIN